MRILIVEDNPIVLGMLSTILDKEQFMVESTTNGDEAFMLAQEKNFDLIILDLVLPGKDGFEVIVSLRSLNINTPILVISSIANVKSRTKALDLGADDYMVKDLCVKELLSRIKSLIRRSHGNAKNIFQCGNLILNLSAMEVQRGGVRINLTKKELGLLVCLFQKQGKIVATKDLIDAGWGTGEYPINSNKLTVHMKSLRKKIDNAFGCKYIHTIRGLGYRLEDESKKEIM